MLAGAAGSAAGLRVIDDEPQVRPLAVAELDERFDIESRGSGSIGRRRAMERASAASADELAGVFARLDDVKVQRAVDTIAAARRIALHGLGREGLQIKGFAMRLFHLGLRVAVVGEMTAPHLGRGDLLVVSEEPDHFTTIEALMDIAMRDGARTLVVTAQPDGIALAKPTWL
jgi:D-arabinose 5-phosphate isomerase GutQ